MQTILVGQDHRSRTLTSAEIAVEKSKAVVDLALSGKRAVGTYTNTDGEQIIAAYAPINLKISIGLWWLNCQRKKRLLAFVS